LYTKEAEIARHLRLLGVGVLGGGRGENDSYAEACAKLFTPVYYSQRSQDRVDRA